MSDRFRPDIVISDRNSDPIAIVEVKRGTSYSVPHSVAQLARYMAALGGSNTFAILADPQYIRVFHGDPAGDSNPITISAPEILRHYDADYESQEVYESYLTSLVEAWLNDLSIHRQSEHPPGENLLPEELVTRLQAA